MRNVQKVRSSNQFGVSSLPQKIGKKVEKKVGKKDRTHSKLQERFKIESVS